MIVSVIGLGYIGLPTAAIISSKGIKVFGIDTNQNIVDSINTGKINISEPRLDVMVQKVLKSKTFKAGIYPVPSDVFMIAVPTPFKNNFKPDLSFVKSAIKAISNVLEKNNIIIIESTCPVGTSEKIIDWIKDERPDLSLPEYGNDKLQNDIAIAYCPERVIPGNVLSEIVENDRIIGGITTNCAERAKDVYKIFVKGECLLTDSRTAELTKLVENSFRDVNIAFANELSLISDKLGINTWELIKFANHHPRVNILKPGPGVGGHCIAVDPWFIIDSAPLQSRLIHTARLVNDGKPYDVIEKVNAAVRNLGQDQSILKVACLGLAFKPDIDDLRESPALLIANKINSMGFLEVLLVEPNISQLPESFLGGASSLVSANEAIKLAEIVVLLVDHTSFKSIDTELLSEKQVIDTIGIWS